MNKDEKIYIAVAATAGVLALATYLNSLRIQRNKRTEIFANHERRIAAIDLAERRVKEAMQSGKFIPTSFAEIETAFDFEVIVALSE